MSEQETSVEAFQRLYLELDARGQKMVALYVHLLGHDREFQKMSDDERRALLDRWFEERSSA